MSRGADICNGGAVRGGAVGFVGYAAEVRGRRTSDFSFGGKRVGVRAVMRLGLCASFDRVGSFCVFAIECFRRLPAGSE